MSLTQARLKELLHYDQGTGKFTWLVGRLCIRKGSIAGTTDIQGYRVVKIDGKSYKAHRLAWLYMVGGWPLDEIDHINTDRADNRWVNLRAATHGQNQANSRVQKNNTSGYKGVAWAKRQRRWRAQIRTNNKTKNLGYFKDISVAAAKYAEAAENTFGKFARTT